METIVVGYDGTDGARGALEQAAKLAAAFKAKVIVASVEEPAVREVMVSAASYAPVGGVPGPAEPLEPSPPEVAEHLLSTGRRFMEERGIEVETAVAFGRPVEELVE